MERAMKEVTKHDYNEGSNDDVNGNGRKEGYEGDKEYRKVLIVMTGWYQGSDTKVTYWDYRESW